MANSDSKAALGKCLASMGLPAGVLSSVYQSYLACDSRLWLIDDSSMMKIKDSHVGFGGKERGTIERIDNVTRWIELKEYVSFHTLMTSKCWVPTTIWFLNDRRKLNLCRGAPEDVAEEMTQIKAAVTGASLDRSACPLASCVRNLSEGIRKRGSDRRTTLVICTQGLPTDREGRSGSDVTRELLEELWKLAKLPVKIIIRLCTDDEKVTDMFNTMDARFDSVDVLDDFWGEALEVYLHNPWLTYSIGMHRLRESGFAPELMDDLDERPLSLDEIHKLCKTLFVGEDTSINLPHPSKGWNEFGQALEKLVKRERTQWNPIKKKMTPWINFRKLEVMHGRAPRRRAATPPPSNGFSRSCQGLDRKKEKASFTSAQEEKKEEMPPFKEKKKWKKPSLRRPNSFAFGQEKEETNTYRAPERTKKKPSLRRPDSFAYGERTSAPPKHRRARVDPPEEEQPSFAPRRSRSARRSQSWEDPAPTMMLAMWASQRPKIETLQHILVTIPSLFPPKNAGVEPHAYFAKWKTFDDEAFADDGGDELKELLKRAVRKAKFFLHPDKLPNDLTENQSLLFKNIWDIIQHQEAAISG